MADDSVVRPARRVIKIKFGNTVVATQAVRVTGFPSSASLDSKDTKSGSALHLARLKQASLKGYVPPTASPDSIVAKLREGEGFAPGNELPAWDFPAPPACGGEERPSKRVKQAAVMGDAKLEPCSSRPAADEPAAGPRPDTTAPVSGRPDPTKDLKPPSNVKRDPAQPSIPVKYEPAPARAAAGVATMGSGESNSDQATNSQVYVPLSPDDPVEGTARAAGGAGTRVHISSGGQSSLASSGQPCNVTVPEQHPRPSTAGAPASSQGAASSSFAATAVTQARERGPVVVSRALPARPAESCSPTPLARGADTQPSTSGRQLLAPSLPAAAGSRVPSGVSVETQTSQRDFPVLPTTFLEISRLSGAALSYQSVGPFDLQLEHDQRTGLVNGTVDGHIAAARQVKREGDQLCHKNGKCWNIKSLSKYVSAALMFMEAAEAMLRDTRVQRLQRVADLFKQTADLLAYTVNLSDSIKGSNTIGKEALRLLAERLCAICLLRHATLVASSYRACAEKAQGALRDHQRQQQAAQLQGAAGSVAGGPQPSPGDSTTSSLHAAHGGPVAGAGALAGGGGAGASHGGAGQAPLPGFTPEEVSNLVSFAKNTCAFAEHMKRSSKGFEAFLERADVRQDQQAKLVCVHLAAICMDMGMGGTRVIQHAREAVRTLCEDLAR